MDFSQFLAREWRPALGCTEPASIAYAASTAASALAGLPDAGPVTSVALHCDPRIYKNCYAVGIPHSDHKVGILWATAIGAHLPDPSARLECFRQIDDDVLDRAGALLDRSAVTVEVDRHSAELLVDCSVRAGTHRCRVVIEGLHTRITRVELDGRSLPVEVDAAEAAGGGVRNILARMPFEELMDLARTPTEADRALLRRGVEYNLAIARHGLSLFPKSFVQMADRDLLTRISRLVCAGVYARMWGEDLVVMSLSGSGNKGITCAVPIALWGEEIGADPALVEDALALATLVTSKTTAYLGTLSAVCGCSNAAGIGLACGLALLQGGGPKAVSLSVSNMVGNVTGMICDGAKIGCALKTMTSVDAAFRAVNLALAGIGIPQSDGIVGKSGHESLENLGRIATRGMLSADAQILEIMEEKLDCVQRTQRVSPSGGFLLDEKRASCFGRKQQ